MNIGGIEIGQGQPCRFCVEVSNSHNGSLDRAYRMIDAAKWAGADFVKFQCFLVDELVALRGDGPAPEPWGSDGWSMRRLYERARTPLEWFPELFAYARSWGIVPFSSVFGLESLAVLESVGCPAYKIAALDNHHRDLIERAVDTDRPVLVSTRGPMLRGGDGQVGWLYCPAGYPTPAADVRLPEFGPQWDDFDGPSFLGLSSHCLDPLLPVAAVARGAKIIEMHMMLDDEPSELEAEVSLTASQFKAMVESVRRTEVLLGEGR